MSANFWIKLVSALTLFGFAIMAVQAYKSGLVRNLRARFLRRKIVPTVQAILPLVIEHANAASFTEVNRLGGRYDLMSKRADLETLFQRAKPLFDQERNTIADFLSKLSQLSLQLDQGQPQRYDVESVVLLGQRVIQELTEIGL